jgi:cytochrome P450
MSMRSRGAVPLAGLADLSDPDSFVAGVPHETFRRLRTEAPVYWHPERDGGGFWVVSRYRDVRTVSLDQATYSSARGGILLRTFPEWEILAQREMIVGMEPGRHGKHRRLVSGAFAPRLIQGLEPYVRRLAGAIIDRIAPRGTCDFVTDVAAELPMQAIAELLGIPQEDRGRIVDWSNRMVGMEDPEFATEPDAGQLAALQLHAYANELAERRRREPRDDIVSALLRAEVDGERLNEAQLGAFFVVLAVAGNETTRNLLSGGLLALFDHPDERARLQGNPALLPTAIDEMLRFVSPIMYFRRTAERDAELAGQAIREGDKVTVWYVSANRDEEVFPEPDRFDVGRTPNDHLAFGFGSHFCLGASLAQLEARVLFEALLHRLPDMAPAGPVERLRSNHMNAIKHMPVRFTPER